MSKLSKSDINPEVLALADASLDEEIDEIKSLKKCSGAGDAMKFLDVHVLMKELSKLAYHKGTLNFTIVSKN
jgi:hypothetical protein